MPKKDRLHIIKSGDVWNVKREGKKTPESKHRTQEEAIKTGRKKAIKEKGQLLIHRGDNNRIREERTYRKDPHPPKG